MRLTIIPVAIQNDVYSPFNIPIIVTGISLQYNQELYRTSEKSNSMAKNNSGKFRGPMSSLVRQYYLALSASYLLHRKRQEANPCVLFWINFFYTGHDHCHLKSHHQWSSAKTLIDQAKCISLYKDGVSAGVPRSSRSPEFVNFRHLYETLTMPLLSLNL